MNNEETAALLMQDIEANMTYLELGILAACLILAIVGLVLAVRAYNALNEVRALYWQAMANNAPGALSKSAADMRLAQPSAIMAASVKKKIKSNRVRGVL